MVVLCVAPLGLIIQFCYPHFRHRIPAPTRENRAHRHPILPKPGKMGALVSEAPALAFSVG